MDKFLKKNKIVDCFFFYDEIEMLKLRVKELSPYVDYFIIIEGKIDFRNNPKNININLKDDFFNDYRQKIHHLVYDEFDKVSLKETYENLKYERKLLSFNKSINFIALIYHLTFTLEKHHWPKFMHSFDN
jgi:hypothetical protein